MSGAIPPLPNTPPWHSAQLKHRDNFTFTFTFYVSIALLGQERVPHTGKRTDIIALKCNMLLITVHT
jgi:hypothetical protein